MLHPAIAITIAITMAQSAEISTQTNDEDNGFEIKISKSKLKEIESNVNCSYWKNFDDLIQKLISLDCEIFGGAARDLTLREYWTSKFYEFVSEDWRSVNKSYDDPSVHPESYEGRRLFPTDLDIFIKGKANFEKVMKYLEGNHKIRNIRFEEDSLPHSPYFLETNAELKKVLEYHRFEIRGMKIPAEVSRMFSCIREFLPEELASKIWTGITIQLDIIVLKDNWEELSNVFCIDDLCPPFGNPDFRCNQLSLVKCKDSNRYELKANMQFIPMLDEREIGFTMRFNRKALEAKQLQREADNLQLIIDDIIAKRAIPASSNPGKSIAPYRILKMEKKGYTIDLSSILPHINTIPLQAEDLCSICLEKVDGKLNVMKPCECSVLLHSECWAQLMRSHNDNGNYQYTCAGCRRDCGAICQHYSGDCTKINMLCAVSHYRDPTNIARKVRYAPMDCGCCRMQRERHVYAAGIAGGDDGDETDDSEIFPDDE